MSDYAEHHSYDTDTDFLPDDVVSRVVHADGSRTLTHRNGHVTEIEAK